MRTSPAVKPNLWQEFKRQSIQEAVIQLMCREGLRSVTMERVAQEVGIAKGTVYLHYRDKQELLDAVKDSALDPMMSKIEEVLTSDLPPNRKLEAYSLRYLGYFDEHRDLFRILLYEREVTRAQAQRYRGTRYRRLVGWVTNVIADGVEAGVFRDVSTEKAAAMFVESNYALMSQRLLSSDTAPVEEDARLISDLFLRGIRRGR